MTFKEEQQWMENLKNRMTEILIGDYETFFKVRSKVLRKNVLWVDLTQNTFETYLKYGFLVLNFTIGNTDSNILSPSVIKLSFSTIVTPKLEEELVLWGLILEINNRPIAGVDAVANRIMKHCAITDAEQRLTKIFGEVWVLLFQYATRFELDSQIFNLLRANTEKIIFPNSDRRVKYIRFSK